MYSTCIFCNAPLGANEAVESFPVGRRLAFDGAKGRLWVVCRSCGRWNLSPVEERWEAIEESERLFRDTRTRVSTENVGLARLPDGTELVRIGRPQRPEFAAWRYGDQFGLRKRRRLIVGGGATAAAVGIGGALALASPMLLMGAVGLLPVILTAAGARRPALGSARRAELALLDDRGEPILGGPGRVFHRARMRTGGEFPEGWWLDLETSRYDPDGNHTYPSEIRKHVVHGPPAVRAVSVFLASANASGGGRAEVQRAVGLLERTGSPEEYFLHAEQDARKRGWGYQEVWHMPREVRLALEMATHEDAERHALEGELAELERQWKSAEEIAAIADRLAIPKEVERKLEQLRKAR